MCIMAANVLVRGLGFRVIALCSMTLVPVAFCFQQLR